MAAPKSQQILYGIFYEYPERNKIKPKTQNKVIRQISMNVVIFSTSVREKGQKNNFG